MTREKYPLFFDGAPYHIHCVIMRGTFRLLCPSVAGGGAPARHCENKVLYVLTFFDSDSASETCPVGQPKFFFWNFASNSTQFFRSKADSIPILGSLEGRESVPPSHFRLRVWEADCLLNQPPKPLT